MNQGLHATACKKMQSTADHSWETLS